MLTGIILTGGNSTRMGTDKSQLKLGSNTLSELAYAKLQPFCKEICYSINKNQEGYDYTNTVLDFYENEGPISGILSSFMFLESDLLILAVDMPNISPQTIENLIQHRNPSKLVTSYFNSEKQQWEGLLSIWEYKSYQTLLTFFENGGRSIQKFLFSHDVEQVAIPNIQEFRNINSMKEFGDLR